MTRIYNKSSETDKRRMLRRSMSKAEVLLWTHLSRKQMLGYKFRRQHGVDQFVIDFYCPKLRLAVEIDGPSHAEQEAVEYDKMRQSYIEALGIRFLRFQNDEIYEDMQSVLESVASKIKSLTTPESPP
ncbi:MAG: endonuclease domain-containing protein [Bacteroidota bacterium]